MMNLAHCKTSRLSRNYFIVLITSLLVSQGALAKTTQTPLEAAFAVKPNVMILLDDSGSMSTKVQSDDKKRKRFEIAQDVITDLIEETSHVRFCLSHFYSPEGARMTDAMQCTSDRTKLDAMVTTIDALTHGGWTPLSESYYDISRYFRGEKAFFGKFGNKEAYTSPIQHRCQTNSVVVITDGEPTQEWEKNKTPTEKDGTKSLPNWDNEPADGTKDTHPFGALSDGYCGTLEYKDCNVSSDTESAKLFLDDLALFGKEWDLITSGDAAGKTDDFLVQNLKTHTIGFELDVQMLRDAAEYGDGEFVEATSPDELKDALESAIVTSLEREGTGAGATQSGISLSEDACESENPNGGCTNLYFSQYDTKNWSGDLLKVQLQEQSDHTLKAKLIWSAAKILDAMTDPVANRVIFTPNDASNGLLDFKSDGENKSLSNSLLAKIHSKTDDSGEYAKAKKIVNYMRGEQTRYRNRDSLLGDLIHSRATYVKNRNYGHLDEEYGDYVTGNAGRTPMIYVGGNDGMLHAFDEKTGVERFAYVPTAVLKNLKKYKSTSYPKNHLYFVDGEMSIVDAKLKDGSDLKWSTVLASPLGAGHKGLFLLDITEPTNGVDDLRGNLFKWEIDDKTKNNNSSVFKRMGYIINPPKVVRFKIPEADNKFHEKWVLISGNGIHSKFNDKDTTIYGAATVFVTDLDTGKLITELVVDNGFVDQINKASGTASYSKFSDGNGLTSVAAVDTDANTFIDRLYGADLKGNLWRFNYNETGTVNNDDAAYIKANLNVAYTTAGGNPGPVFTATGGKHPIPYTGSYIQPITAEITVTAAPAASGTNVGEMVFFGTGQFYDFVHLLDDVNDKVQTMYAFWDKGNWDSSSSPKTRSDLQEQTIVQKTVDEEEVRTLPTANDIDYTTQLGWFMDLPERGERITRKSVGLFEHVAFFTQSPVSGDPCVEGINGWSMIAKKDTATPIAVTLASGGGGTTSNLGTKHTGNSIHDPIFVELSDGQFVAPVVIDASGDTPTVEHTVQIQKDYSRASWKRLEL